MSHSRYHNEYEDNAVCFWTSSVVDYIPVLRSPAAARALLTMWDTYRARYGVKLLGYVVMPEHAHIAIWSPTAERAERFVEQTLRRSSAEIVGMTARAASAGNPLAVAWLEAFRSHGRGRTKARVWKERGRAFPVSSHEALIEKLEYIHGNPVRRGLAESAEGWEFSSAAYYARGSGPIAMDEFSW